MAKPTSNQLVIIGGPTASGKTSLSIKIANHFSCPIISADSRQCYKELNIGTAKPSKEEIQKTKHYFINSHHIYDEYNAGIFSEQSRELISKLFIDHSVVVITGGSGLYIDALLFGVDDLPGNDESVRKDLNSKFEKYGIGYIRKKLLELDPDYYHSIDLNNVQRIIRGIEVSLISGKPYSTLLNKKDKKSLWPYKICGISYEREELYDRINRRVDLMIEEGLVEEVKKLSAFSKLNALQTVGYSEIFEFIENKKSLNEAVELIKKNTRNYAKRQLTWFRKYQEMVWFEPDESDKIIKWILNQDD